MRLTSLLLALASAAAPSFAAPTTLLSNSYLSLSFDSTTHQLLQFSNLLTSPPTNLLRDGATASTWWNAFIAAPTFNQANSVQRIDATTATNAAVELIQGDGYTNATFSYEFQFFSPAMAAGSLHSADAGSLLSAPPSVDLTLNVTLYLLDDSSQVEIFFFASKGNAAPSNAQVGFLNVSASLSGIDPLACGSDVSDWLALPVGFGVIESNPTRQLSGGWRGTYPDSESTYQSVMYYFNQTDPETFLANGPGLSVEARDTLGAYKVFEYALSQPTAKHASMKFASTPTFDLSLTVFPLNSGQDLSQQNCVQGSSLLIPFSIVWTVFRGDWADGIANYGPWARTSAEWTKGGPIAQRADIPSWLQGMNIWMNTGWQEVDIFNTTQGDPATVLDRIPQILAAIDVSSPVGLHWYEWNTSPFDTGYPDYLPAKAGFTEVVSQLHDILGAGRIKIAPYINGRIFDIAAPSWNEDHAESFAAKSVSAGFEQNDYTLYEESYGSGSTFSVMCPATPYWQQTLTTVAKELIALGIDGLYIDQVAAATTKPCFDPTHQHSVGDGRSWIEGNNLMLQSVGDVLAAGSTQGGDSGGANSSFIVTESNAESFMAHVSIYLTLVAFDTNLSGNSQRLIGVFPHIYGGLYTSMGAEYFLADLLPDPNVFAAKLSWQFHNGAAMGWWSLGGTTTSPQMGLYDTLMRKDSNTKSFVYEPEFEWIRTLDAFRTLAGEYLVQGSKCRDLPFEYSPIYSSSSATSTITTDDDDVDSVVTDRTPNAFAHPHRNELHVTVRPRPDHHESQSHNNHHATSKDNSNLRNTFTYSPVQGSVWRSADATSLAFLFSCSSTIDSYTSPSSYSLNFSNLNVQSYGIQSGLESSAWTLNQWDAAGSLIGVQSFNDGTHIALQITLNCRDMQFFTLNIRASDKLINDQPLAAEQ